MIKKSIGPEFIEDILSVAKEGDLCEFKGRIISIRTHSKIAFFDLGDHTGKLQIVLSKNKLEDFKQLVKLTVGSYVSVQGRFTSGENTLEVSAEKVEIVSRVELPLSPTPWEINGMEAKNTNNLFNYTEFYLANPQRAAILKIKTTFVQELHNYFQKNKFTMVEPPILTEKILYEPEKAISAMVHKENVFLSQCATFELEPLAMVFGKVYTISPAFRNEKGGSKRHLAEYTHAKAELLFANLSDLKFLAGDSIYHAIKETVEKCPREFSLLEVDLDLEAIRP